MKSNEELENDIEDLRKELYFLTKQSSEGETGGDSSGGGSDSTDDEGWQVLYDYQSEDPNINLGHTAGLSNRHGVVTELPDLVNFNKLKVLFFASNSENYYEFDISKKKTNGLRILLNSSSLNQIFGADMTVLFDDNGKFVLDIGRINYIYFYTSGKVPSIQTSPASCCFRKILAK